MLLAVDTATQTLSLALHDGDQLHAEQTWYSPNAHTVELAPAIRSMLTRADVPIAALKALAVSTGPGSYTGLRIGVALAKAIASARGLPLVGVSSLDALATGQPHFQGGLIAVVLAGRGRVIAASYQWRKGRWKQRHEPQLMNWETLIASIDGPACLTGEVDAAGRSAIRAAQATSAPIVLAPAAARLRRAGYLAEEAWARLNEAGDDAFAPAGVVPVYVQTRDIPG
jgi:tRNA threonylcarbamoyladenosine biosynthesis protein TsaB